MGQYSKLLTKNTPPPNIKNIDIILILRIKGGIITLNKNEFLVAKLSPAQLKLQLSWAEFALFPLSPTDHPTTHPPRESLFLKLQQVLMFRNFVCGPAQHQLKLVLCLL